MSQPFLKFGSNGPFVEAVQWFFNEVSVAHPELKLDGIFGKLTHAATLQFQSNHALKADGIIGPLTWSALVQSNERSGTGSSARQPSTAASHGGTVPRSYARLVEKHQVPTRQVSASSSSAGSPQSAPRGRLPRPSGGGFASAASPSPTGIDEATSIVDPRGLGPAPGNKFVVGLIYFKTNSFALDSQDRQELRKLAAYLRFLDQQPIHFTFEGWADPRGSGANNSTLSKRRAEHVERFVRLNVFHDHANFRRQVVARGEFKGPALDNPFQRFVMVLAPRLPSDRKQKKKTITRREKILRALLAIGALPGPVEQDKRLTCIFTKLLAAEGGPQIDDHYFNGKDSFFVGAMRAGTRGPFTAEEKKKWLLSIREFDFNSTFFDKEKHGLSDLHAFLQNLDEKILEGKNLIETQINRRGGESSARGNVALIDAFNYLKAKRADHRHIYSCYT